MNTLQEQKKAQEKAEFEERREILENDQTFRTLLEGYLAQELTPDQEKDAIDTLTKIFGSEYRSVIRETVRNRSKEAKRIALVEDKLVGMYSNLYTKPDKTAHDIQRMAQLAEQIDEADTVSMENKVKTKDSLEFTLNEIPGYKDQNTQVRTAIEASLQNPDQIEDLEDLLESFSRQFPYAPVLREYRSILSQMRRLKSARDAAATAQQLQSDLQAMVRKRRP
jgi:hypothetical protein